MQMARDGFEHPGKELIYCLFGKTWAHKHECFCSKQHRTDKVSLSPAAPVGAEAESWGLFLQVKPASFKVSLCRSVLFIYTLLFYRYSDFSNFPCFRDPGYFWMKALPSSWVQESFSSR